jgi:hypothetical protein
MSARQGEVAHAGNRIDMGVDHLPPALVRGRLPERQQVVLDVPPPDQQQVAAGLLDTVPELMPAVAAGPFQPA